MFMRNLRFAGAALALAGAAWVASFAPTGDGPLDYKFRASPVGSLGVQSLADLRGKPVLIDFWGTR